MTLTELSYASRKIAPFLFMGGAVLLFFLLIIILITSSSSKSPPTITLNPVFGKLDPLLVIDRIDYPQNAEFILDNIEGRPINATQASSIYFIPKERSQFGYLDDIYHMAESAGFDKEVIKHRVQDNQATFADSTKSLVIDIGNKNFSYSYKYESLPDLFFSPAIPKESSISRTASSYLERMGRYPNELRKGREEIRYLYYDSVSNSFSLVSSPEQANVVEVDYYRPDDNGLPVFSPRYYTSHNYVIMTYPEGRPTIIKAQVRFFDRDTSTIGTYPLKGGDDAWNDLVNGNAVIIINQNPGRITITDMFVGYLDPEVYQPYMQPVYVFVGGNNFVAYVQAVRKDFVK